MFKVEDKKTQIIFFHDSIFRSLLKLTNFTKLKSLESSEKSPPKWALSIPIKFFCSVWFFSSTSSAQVIDGFLVLEAFQSGFLSYVLKWCRCCPIYEFYRNTCAGGRKHFRLAINSPQWSQSVSISDDWDFVGSIFFLLCKTTALWLAFNPNDSILWGLMACRILLARAKSQTARLNNMVISASKTYSSDSWLIIVLDWSTFWIDKEDILFSMEYFFWCWKSC